MVGLLALSADIFSARYTSTQTPVHTQRQVNMETHGDTDTPACGSACQVQKIKTDTGYICLSGCAFLSIRMANRKHWT